MIPVWGNPTSGHLWLAAILLGRIGRPDLFLCAHSDGSRPVQQDPRWLARLELRGVESEKCLPPLPRYARITVGRLDDGGPAVNLRAHETRDGPKRRYPPGLDRFSPRCSVIQKVRHLQIRADRKVKRIMIHVVKRGESLSAIANQYKDNGIKNWQEIYNDKSNATFRAKRKDPNLIQPGDRINIPLLELRIQDPVTGVAKTYLMTRDALDQVVDAALAKIKQDILPKAKLRLELARVEYNTLKELVDSNRFIAWTLNVLNVFEDLTPSDAALKRAEQAAREVDTAIAGRFIPKVKSKLEEFEKEVNQAIKIYSKAREGLGSTAGRTVTGLEITKTLSFTVVGAYVTLATGGTIAAPAAMTARGAALGYPAALSMVKTAADEGGKAIAGGKNQTAVGAAANILTAGAVSLFAGKAFGHPKAKEFIGKLAYRIAPRITPQKLGIVVKTGTVKDLLEQYMTGVGKNSLQTVVQDGVKATHGEMTLDDLINRLDKHPLEASKKTFFQEFTQWAIKTGAASPVK
jgi:hypothetical protein